MQLQLLQGTMESHEHREVSRKRVLVDPDKTASSMRALEHRSPLLDRHETDGLHAVREHREVDF